MTTVRDSITSPRQQHLIVTVFGLYARQHDGALAVAELIRLLDATGVEAAAVRSAVSRLKRRGVLESVKKGTQAGYRLAPDLDEVFRAGDKRIFSPRRARASDPWILASFSVPESERHLRHRIRSILTRLGCGQVSPGLWIAPDTIAQELHRTLEHARLADYVELFRATHLSMRSSRETVGRWWDLEALDALYADFLERTAAVRARWLTEDPAADPEAAFADEVALLTEWRRLPYLDPGLAVEHLPEGWSGLEAERIFAELHERLAPAARRFADSIIAEH